MAKLSYNQVQAEINMIPGFRLISTEYRNLDQPLTIECPEKHQFIKTLKQWRRNQTCLVCAEQAKLVEHLSADQDMDIIPKAKGVQRVLALDNSSTITGYAIFDDGKLIKHGKKILTYLDNTTQRIAYMRQWMLSMMREWKPDVVALEDIQLQENINTYKVLAKLQGVMEITLFENNCIYYIVHSATWKSYNEVKGKNRAQQKESAQNVVKANYGIIVTQDEADAICLGRYVVNKHLKRNTFIEWGL